MKTYLLLITCFILTGCGREEANNREVLNNLETIKSELATRRGAPVRWAFANKREIDTVLFLWSRDKIEEARKSESLSPEITEKVRQYEALQSELMQKQMDAFRLRLPQRVVGSETPAAETEYEALSQKVAEAKVPIADIVDRHDREAAQYRNRYTTEKLIAEYAKDRFDLIVDSSGEHSSASAVLYRTSGEVLEITDGVIKFFKENAKP